MVNPEDFPQTIVWMGKPWSQLSDADKELAAMWAMKEMESARAEARRYSRMWMEALTAQAKFQITPPEMLFDKKFLATEKRAIDMARGSWWLGFFMGNLNGIVLYIAYRMLAS